jgi:glycosyltransferase involved in cell wall biosynthesis
MPTARTPLRIVHAVLSLDVGGLERIVLGLARAARRGGQWVAVVCVERPGRLAVHAEAAGAVVVSLDKPPGRRPEYVGKAARILDGLKADVVHTHQIGAAWYFGSAARLRGGPPVLHTEHGNHFARTNGYVEALKARLFFHKAAKRVDRFCCVSREIAASAARWRTVAKAKIDVVPNGIDPNRTEGATREEVRAMLGLPPGAFLIGTVGRLTEVKRQDLLIRAFARIGLNIPESHLVLVGDGPDRGILEALAKSSEIADRVHFAGYQTCPEEYFRAIDVFALTSRSEGFPVSLLEAWAAGKPVVSTAVGGIPEVMVDGKTGILVPAGDEIALANAFSGLQADPALAARLGEAGRAELLNKYSLDKTYEEYRRRYLDLIDARSIS